MLERPSYLRDGTAIYERSFAIIRAEADLERFSPEEAEIAIRMIHAAGQVTIAEHIQFSPGLVTAARAALKDGAPILCDAEMVAHGVTRARLPANSEVICTLRNRSVPDLAAKLGTTRSAAALELWRDRLKGAVVAIGNAYRGDHEDAGGGGDRAALGPPLGAAVVERQQEQQDHADRRHADRRERHEPRRLDHAQDLEQEEEVPLRPRHVGRRRRVRLRAELGAEHDRHRDDHDHHDDAIARPWRPRRGRTASPAPSGSSTRGGTAPSRAGSSRRCSSRSSSWRSAFSHGGAVVPSFATRYRCAPISAAIAPGHEQHVDRVEARQRRRAELGAAAQEVRQVRADERAGAVDVHAHDRRPVGALVERQQVAGERHRHRQDQQHDADHPVELARVLVGAEEERPAPCAGRSRITITVEPHLCMPRTNSPRKTSLVMCRTDS